VRASAPTQIT